MAEPQDNTTPPPPDSRGVAGLRQTLDRLPKQRRWIVFGATAAVVAGLIFVAAGGASGEVYRPVARGLGPEDLDVAVSTFEEKKIPYKLEDGGTVSVPEANIHEARLALAVGTMPSGRAPGFELFDASDMGRSAFSEKVNYHRALEGELSRTIRHIEGIARARVHLVMPARRVFRELDVEPSASVVLELKPGFEVGARQAQAIRTLVAGAVERLDPGRVAIVDQYGSMLARPHGGVGGVDNAANFEQQTGLEQQLEERVVHLLEPVVGAGKVRAQVALSFDYAHVVETSEKFDPEGQVVRSEREQIEKSESTREDGGPVGTAANLPRPADTGAGGAGSQSSKERSDSIKNYDIDKETKRRENQAPRVERMSISVLVDEAAAPAGAEGTVPRTPEEIAQYKSVVASAVGLDTTRGDKIEVVSMRFAPITSFDEPDDGADSAAPAPASPFEDPVVLGAIGGGVLLTGGLVWWIMRRRRKKREKEEAAKAAKTGSKLDMIIDEPIILTSAEAEERRRRIEALRDRAATLAKEDVRRLAAVFEGWFELDARAAAQEAEAAKAANGKGAPQEKAA